METPNKKFRSIMEEVSNYSPQKDREQFLESRVQQLVASASHLIKLIKETYDADLAEELNKRLLNSVKSGDHEKFGKKIRQVRSDKLKGE